MFSTDQFIENIVVEWVVFAGAAAFDVLKKVGHGIAGAADRDIADCTHDLPEPLFVPGAVARIRRGHHLPDEILEDVD